MESGSRRTTPKVLVFDWSIAGKSDQSAAGAAYDALVNQLLTLMDGLNEVHNTLVVGLTNRKELLDPALLRPGR